MVTSVTSVSVLGDLDLIIVIFSVVWVHLFFFNNAVIISLKLTALWASI